MKSFFVGQTATALAKAMGNQRPAIKKRVGWGNRFAMDARTSIEKRLPSRHMTEGSERAPHAALHLAAIVHDFDLFDAAEIFKKTPYVADLKPGGRDVAKDMFEIGHLPLLTGIGALNVKLTDVELAERKTKWRSRQTNHTSGALWKFAQQVGPAMDGAVTYPGGAHEKQCYADI